MARARRSRGSFTSTVSRKFLVIRSKRGAALLHLFYKPMLIVACYSRAFSSRPMGDKTDNFSSANDDLTFPVGQVLT